eukprot:g19415.t1
MFEETEATKATGYKGFRVMLFLGEDWAHYMINKGGGFVLKASPYSYVWRNKGTMVKESVTARFHGFRMKAAAAVEHIDENVRQALPRGGPRSASSGSQPYFATTSATWSQAPRG